jgi:hypothetical protein
MVLLPEQPHETAAGEQLLLLLLLLLILLMARVVLVVFSQPQKGLASCCQLRAIRALCLTGCCCCWWLWQASSQCRVWAALEDCAAAATAS